MPEAVVGGTANRLRARGWPQLAGNSWKGLRCGSVTDLNLHNGLLAAPARYDHTLTGSSAHALNQATADFGVCMGMSGLDKELRSRQEALSIHFPGPTDSSPGVGAIAVTI